MAALLRRIGGSVLQRTQAAAVAEERRRLVPRRLYSTDEQAHEELTRKIQQKKEELYDVICKAEQSFWTSSFRNRRLLRYLAVQVKPRPEDSKWRRLCFSKRAINVVETAGLVAFTGVVASVGLHLKRFIEDIVVEAREGAAMRASLIEAQGKTEDRSNQS